MSSRQKYLKPISIGSPGTLENYLIQWRLSLFQSIRHKELIIWSFLAFYIGAIGLILGKPLNIEIPRIATEMAIVILSVLGIMVVMDAAIWQGRNLFTISRIEKLFIGNGAGQLIPKSYLEYKFRYPSVYEVHIFFFSIIVLLFYAFFAYPFWMHPKLTQPSESAAFIFITFVTLFGFCWICWWEKRLILQEYYKHFRDKFSIDISDTYHKLKKASKRERSASVFEGPGRMCSAWIVSTVTGIAVGIIGLNLFRDQPYMFTILPVIWSLLWLIMVFIWWKKRKTYDKHHNLVRIPLLISLVVFLLFVLYFVVKNYHQFDPKMMIV